MIKRWYLHSASFRGNRLKMVSTYIATREHAILAELVLGWNSTEKLKLGRSKQTWRMRMRAEMKNTSQNLCFWIDFTTIWPAETMELYG